MQISEYTKIARRVRKAIEECDKTDRLCLSQFPRGACGDASELLARLLREHYEVDAFYVSAIRTKPEYWTHAWVESEGITIDITADQFGESPVIVSQNSSWHLEWDENIEARKPCLPGPGWPQYPHAAWHAIMCEFSDARRQQEA